MLSVTTVKPRDNAGAMEGYGNKIKTARKAAHLNQTQLADKVGVDRVTVSNWEREKHTVTPLHGAKLCEVLKSLKLEEIVSSKGLKQLSAAASANGDLKPRSRLPYSEEAMELASLWDQLPADNLTKKYTRDAITNEHKSLFPDFWLFKSGPPPRGNVKPLRKR